MEDKIEACYQAIMNVDIPQVRHRLEGCRRSISCSANRADGKADRKADRAPGYTLDHFGGRPSKVRANDYSDKTLRACALWRECEVGKQWKTMENNADSILKPLIAEIF